MTATLAPSVGARTDDASLQRFLVPARRGWYVVALLTLYGAFVGWILPAFLPEEHTATSDVLLRPVIADPTSNLRVEQLVSLDTEAVVLRSDPVLQVAADQLRVPIGRLREGLRVTAVPSSQVLQVGMTLDSAKDATLGSTAVAEAYLEERTGRAEALVAAEVSAIEAQVAATNDRLNEVSARVIAAQPGSAERANLQTQQSATAQQLAALQTRKLTLERTQIDSGSLLRGPKGAERTGFGRLATVPGGAVVGLLAGLGLALLLDRLRRFVRHSVDVERATGVPVLVEVDQDAGDDIYRRALLALAPSDDAVLAVVAATGTAARLASVAARGGSDVALVVLDPGALIDEGLEVTSLARVLGDTDLGAAPCTEVGAGLLTVYLTNPSLEERATPLALATAVRRLRAAHDLVVVDTPDPEHSALAEGFVRTSDQTVIAPHVGSTRLSALRETTEHLTAAGHAPSGALLLR